MSEKDLYVKTSYENSDGVINILGEFIPSCTNCHIESNRIVSDDESRVSECTWAFVQGYLENPITLSFKFNFSSVTGSFSVKNSNGVKVDELSILDTNSHTFYNIGDVRSIVLKFTGKYIEINTLQFLLTPTRKWVECTEKLDSDIASFTTEKFTISGYLEMLKKDYTSISLDRRLKNPCSMFSFNGKFSRSGSYFLTVRYTKMDGSKKWDFVFSTDGGIVIFNYSNVYITEIEVDTFDKKNFVDFEYSYTFSNITSESSSLNYVGNINNNSGKGRHLVLSSTDLPGVTQLILNTDDYKDENSKIYSTLTVNNISDQYIEWDEELNIKDRTNRKNIRYYRDPHSENTDDVILGKNDTYYAFSRYGYYSVMDKEHVVYNTVWTNTLKSPSGTDNLYVYIRENNDWKKVGKLNLVKLQ